MRTSSWYQFLSSPKCLWTLSLKEITRVVYSFVLFFYRIFPPHLQYTFEILELPGQKLRSISSLLYQRHHSYIILTHGFQPLCKKIHPIEKHELISKSNDKPLDICTWGLLLTGIGVLLHPLLPCRSPREWRSSAKFLLQDPHPW